MTLTHNWRNRAVCDGCESFLVIRGHVVSPNTGRQLALCAKCLKSDWAREIIQRG
jgi:RNase P subunit RPR2